MSSTAQTGSTSPPPLPAHAVTLLLSYLSPLDRPLPPHLLSTPLRQRHTFLGLGHDLDSTEDAATYLSWPVKSASDDSTEEVQRVLADLIAALPSPDNFDPLYVYPTKYTFDGEAVFAHACVPVQSFSRSLAPEEDPRGLRLVFRWEADENEGGVVGHGGNAADWKYHDAKPMPYPSGAQDSPDAALSPSVAIATPTHMLTNGTSAAASLTPSGSVSRPPVSVSSGFTPNQYHAEVSHESDSDDDAYWNSYGRSGSDDEEDDTIAGAPRGIRASGGETDEEKAEDAYWARYSTVHGTADSTRPSPLAPKRKLHDPSQPLPVPSDSFDFEQIECLDFNNQLSSGTNEDDFRVLHTLARFSDMLDPSGLSPEALARRLESISPRPSLPSVGPSPAPLQRDGFTAASHSKMINRVELDIDALSSPPTSGSDGGLTLTPPANATSAPLATDSPRSGSDSSSVEIHSPRPTNARERASLAASPASWEDSGADACLRDAIKGVYNLWAGARKQGSPIGTDEKEAFMDIVRDVLADA